MIRRIQFEIEGELYEWSVIVDYARLSKKKKQSIDDAMEYMVRNKIADHYQPRVQKTIKIEDLDE